MDYDKDDIGDVLGLIRRIIDQDFGDGYAAKNPTLLASIYLGSCIERLAEKLSSAIDRHDGGGSYFESGLKEAAEILASRKRE